MSTKLRLNGDHGGVRGRGHPQTGVGLATRILIVDDNQASLKHSSIALEMKGYIVELASDEHEAEEILGRTTPDLVLMDLALPGVERLARSLKTDRRSKHVTIVALTGSAAGRENVRAYEAGFDGCMIKPVDARKLPLHVAAFLVRGPAPGNGAATRESTAVQVP